VISIYPGADAGRRVSATLPCLWPARAASGPSHWPVCSTWGRLPVDGLRERTVERGACSRRRQRSYWRAGARGPSPKARGPSRTACAIYSSLAALPSLQPACCRMTVLRGPAKVARDDNRRWLTARWHDRNHAIVPATRCKELVAVATAGLAGSERLGHRVRPVHPRAG
jgi:hypothetical protein